MVIKGNVLLSLNANRTNEIRMDFISTQSMASPGSLSEMQTLRLHTDLLSQNLYFRKIPKETTSIQLDVVEAETEEIIQGNILLRARRTTKRLSVTSLPSGLQKVPYSSKKRPYLPALKKKETWHGKYPPKIRFDSRKASNAGR
uniref:Uncharacterized protein n=1 Tax=Rousettus aegyptiacus TaxID=9407 RepID=A0A7J8HN63_ROUAE|nr:hypothetical protein HJG63_001861 [Rousettus aegyptiacus]